MDNGEARRVSRLLTGLGRPVPALGENFLYVFKPRPGWGARKGGAACSASASSLPASLPGGRAPMDRRLQRRYMGREQK